MKKFRAPLSAVCLLVLGLNPVATFSQTLAGAGATATNASVTYVRDVLPIILGRCSSCHNDQTRFLSDWSDYTTAFKHRVEIKRRVWDSWKGKYYRQPMPVGNSPQCLAMTEAERKRVKEWVETGAVYGVAPTAGSAKTKPERIEFGRQLYAMACLPCHQAGGQGITDRFPPLAASDYLNADKDRVITILLNGRQGEMVVNGRNFNNTMPRFPLTDEDIANVLTYVYNSFGNSGGEVTPTEVKSLRAQKDTPVTRSQPTANKPSPFE